MTGYTVHTGSSEDFASGWDRVFGDKKKKASQGKEKSPKAKAKSSGQKPKKKK